MINPVKSNFIYIPKELYTVSVILAVISVIGILSFFVNNGDFLPEYILKPIRNIILIIILTYFIQLRKISLHDVLALVVFIITLHSIVIYLQYILYVTDISKDFLYHPSLTWSSPIRKVGLSTGFPSAGLIIIFSVLISFYLYYIKHSKLFFVLALVQSPALFVTSRAAMYIYIAVVPLYLLYLSYKKGSILPFLGYAVFFLAGVIVVYLYLMETVQGSVDKMFVNAVNYYNTGSFHDYSTRHLISDDHLYFPESVKTFLIGNSLGKESGFQQSDISYVRITIGTGVFSLIFYLVAYVMLLHNSMSAVKHNYSLKLLLVALFLSFFLMSFKGHYVFSRIVGDIILIVTVAVIHQSRYYIIKHYANNKSQTSLY